MITEDQVVAMFAKANPVPSLDLLDPIEQVDPGHLEDRSERSSGMTELKTIEKQEAGRRQRWILPAVATVAVLVVAIPFLLNRQNLVGSDSTSPMEVVTAYNEAEADSDYEAMEQLVAPDSDLDFDRIRAHDEWEQATDWVFTQLGCELRPGDETLVYCPYSMTNPWFEALGLEPAVLEDVFQVEDGLIQTITDNPEVQSAQAGQAWDAFRMWVIQNHTADVGTMYESGDPNLTPESIALWEHYTEEYLAEMTG